MKNRAGAATDPPGLYSKLSRVGKLQGSPPRAPATGGLRCADPPYKEGGFERIMTLPSKAFLDELAAKNPGRTSYATEVVDLILAEARAVGASDVHFQPTADGL